MYPPNCSVAIKAYSFSNYMLDVFNYSIYIASTLLIEYFGQNEHGNLLANL